MILLPCDVSDAPISDREETSAAARLEADRVLVVDYLKDLRRGFQEVVEASTDSNADDEHDPEGSTIAFERSQLGALIRQAEQHLDDIENARAKVARGRYGLCETCGRPISGARLQVRPVARNCVECADLAK